MAGVINVACLLIVTVLLCADSSFGQLVCEPYWTAQYKCMQHCGQCADSNTRTDALRSYSSLEIENQRKAESADQDGLNALNRGDWGAAINRFMEALELAPDNNTIRSHLHRAEQGLSDAKSAQDMAALHQRILDAIYAADTKLRRKRFEDAMSRPAPETERRYSFAGNGLIGGTAWTVFASRSPGESAKRMCNVIKQQAKLAASDFDAGADCERYQFVLGMATSIDPFTDLTHRVAFDDLTNGRFSATQQGLYDKLRGKQFDELGCHSNGAMICLAALANGDAKATNVLLYGPQVTRESLTMWNELVRKGRVKSVKVYINENDIVPGVSIAFADFLSNKPLGRDFPLFQIDSLRRTINEVSPRLLIQTFPCSRDKFSLGCHFMTMYKLKVSCTGKSSGKTVSGTGFHGQDDLPEPPLPCDAI